MSPREFFSLLERHKDREELLNYRSGLAAAQYVNMHRDPSKSEPVQPLDFFRPVERRQKSSAELIAMFESARLARTRKG